MNKIDQTNSANFLSKPSSVPEENKKANALGNDDLKVLKDLKHGILKKGGDLKGGDLKGGDLKGGDLKGGDLKGRAGETPLSGDRPAQGENLPPSPLKGDRSSRDEGAGGGDEKNLGNTILQALGGQSASISQSGTLSSSNLEASGVKIDYNKIEELLAKVAHRVLASDPVSGQNPEVRVQMSADVMQGTEVRVWKGDGGRLHVEFETSSSQWAKVLSDSVAILSDRLGTKINLSESPVVSVLKSSEQEMAGDSGSKGDDNQREDNPPEDFDD